MLLSDEIRDSWHSESRDHRLALLIILVIGVALRLTHLAQPMRYDEAVTYTHFVRLDWSDALSTYTYPNNHLFHTALAKASVTLFGHAPWALRLPAFLAGCALVIATYAMARVLYGGGAALVATSLVAASGALVLYSTNARGYTIVALAFVLLVLQGARLLRGAPTREWLTFAVIAAIGLWTIPVMVYPLGAVAAWFLLSCVIDGRLRELRSLWIALGIAAGLTLLAYAPVVSREGLAAVARNRFVVPSGWMDFLRELPLSVGQALSSWALGVPPIVSAAFLACAVLALGRHASLSRFRVGLPLASFVWCCWVLVVNHRAPFARVWLWLLPLVAALAGAGVVSVLTGWTRTRRLITQRTGHVAVGIAFALAISLWLSRAVNLTTDTGSFRDASRAAAALGAFLQPGDRILVSIPSNGPLHYYMEQRGLDSSYLSLDERRARRIIAVVDRAEGQSLAAVVARSLVRDTLVFSQPRVIARFSSSTLVLFQRRDVQTR